MKKNRENRKPQISFEASPELVKEFKDVSQIVDIPQAQIARDAIREKILNLKDKHPAFKTAENPLAK